MKAFLRGIACQKKFPFRRVALTETERRVICWLTFFAQPLDIPQTTSAVRGGKELWYSFEALPLRYHKKRSPSSLLNLQENEVKWGARPCLYCPLPPVT